MLIKISRYTRTVAKKWNDEIARKRWNKKQSTKGNYITNNANVQKKSKNNI